MAYFFILVVIQQSRQETFCLYLYKENASPNVVITMASYSIQSKHILAITGACLAITLL